MQTLTWEPYSAFLQVAQGKPFPSGPRVSPIIFQRGEELCLGLISPSPSCPLWPGSCHKRLCYKVQKLNIILLQIECASLSPLKQPQEGCHEPTWMDRPWRPLKAHPWNTHSRSPACLAQPESAFPTQLSLCVGRTRLWLYLHSEGKEKKIPPTKGWAFKHTRTIQDGNRHIAVESSLVPSALQEGANIPVTQNKRKVLETKQSKLSVS